MTHELSRLRLVHDRRQTERRAVERLIDTPAVTDALTGVHADLQAAAQLIQKAHHDYVKTQFAGALLPDAGQQAVKCSQAILDAAASVRHLRLAFHHADGAA